jgi:hypothetical protein
MLPKSSNISKTQDLRVGCRFYRTMLVKVRKSKYSHLRRIDYKGELLNLCSSLHFAYIFLCFVHFELFSNSKKYFHAITVL